MKKAITSLCIAGLLTGCAPSSEKVQPTYVSPLQYQGYSCNQIRQEMMIVAHHVSEVSGSQDHQASNDTAAMGVGLVLFWPALFFLANKDQREELGRLKGEYEALEETAVRKNCGVAKELAAARQMEDDRKAKQAAPAAQNAQQHAYHDHD